MTREATCIDCGCTDSHACEGGCSWVCLRRQVGLGLCSSCGDPNNPLDLLRFANELIVAGVRFA